MSATTFFDPTLVSPQITATAQNNLSTEVIVPQKEVSWVGYTVSKIGSGISSAGNAIYNGVSTTVNTVGSIFRGVVSGASQVASDSFLVAHIGRRLNQQVLRLCEHARGAPQSLHKVAEILKHCVSFVDFVQIAYDIHYLFFSKEVKEANNLTIAGRLSILAASVGGALLWLEEMSFFTLATVAEKIGDARIFSSLPSIVASIPVLRDFQQLHTVANALGELRVFSFIKNLSCLPLVLRALDLAYACFALDAAVRLWNADTQVKTIAAAIDLSGYLSELFLSAIIVAGVTNVVAIGAAGAACIAFAVSSYLYHAEHKNELSK